MNDDLFSDYKDYNPDSPLFDNFKYQSHNFSKNEFPISRINDLFQNGSITAEEHSFLIHEFYPSKPETRISMFAVASLVTASLNWILMLKFTRNGEFYELLSGNGRTTAGTILAPLAVVLFVAAFFEIRQNENIKGLNIAIAGLTIAIAILTIIIPIKILL